MCVFNTVVTAFPGATSPPIPLWLAHMAWNLFCDPRVDVLGRRGTFFSRDFGLLRIGFSSAVHSGSLDSLHSSPGTSFSSAWALGLRWNGLNPLGPSGPTCMYVCMYVCMYYVSIIHYIFKSKNKQFYYLTM